LAIAAGQPGRISLHVTMSVTGRDAKTWVRGSSVLDLEKGEERQTFLYSSDDCLSGGVSASESLGSIHAIQWRLEARALSVGAEEATFELDWRRFDAARRGGTAEAAGDRRTIRLGSGERHVLDYRPCPAGSPHANVLVEVSAASVQAEEGRYSAELWLLHQATDGRRTTRKVVVAEGEGDKAPFRFAPVALPLYAAAVESPLAMQVDGSLTLYGKQDGKIGLVLETSRTLRHPSGSGADAGRKILSAAPGEVVEILLPPVTGRSQWRMSGEETQRGTPLLPGVTLSQNLVAVDYATFLVGTRTSLILKVTKLR
jgi:hypothetical protein